MKRVPALTVLAALVFTLPAHAAEVVTTLEWDALAEEARTNPSLALMPTAEGTAIAITNDTASPKRVQIVDFPNPGVTTRIWAARGKARFFGPAEGTYLEMWSHFGDREKYFSRAAALPRDPADQDDWVEYVIPFFAEGSDRPLRRLTFDVHIAPGAALDLGPIDIVQYADGESPIGNGVVVSWWSPAQAGLLGGFVGGLLGACGALVGFLVYTGHQRRFAINMLRVMAVFGMVLVLVAVFALLREQPYEVWYPPALIGFIAAVLGIVLNPVASRIYDNRASAASDPDEPVPDSMEDGS